MAENDLVARFKTEGQRRFIGDFRTASRGVKDFGQETVKAGGRARNARGQFVSTGEAAEKAGRKARRGAAGFAKLRGGFSRGGFGIGGPLGLAAGLFSTGAAVNSMASEFQESVKVGAQTSAVLKSTGREAGISKRHIENLSGALSRKIGKDDEEIQATANLLLTFKKLRNERGKGNKVFDRSVTVAEDLAVALRTNTRSAAIMVGKALNDPVKGLTALGRAGVQFSKTQKKTIERLVETGDRLGAQRIILRELESQVKGSAAAQATPIDRLRVSWGNLAESMGKLGAPIVTKGITKLTGFLDHLQSGGGIEGRVNKIAGTVKGLVKLVAGAEDAPRLTRPRSLGHGQAPLRPPRKELSTFESFAKRSGEIFRTVKGAATEAGRSLIDAFAPAMPFLRNVLLPVAVGVGKGVVGSLVVGFRLLTPVLRVATSAIKTVATVLGWVGKQAKPLRGWIDKLGIALGIVSKGPMLAMGVAARTASAGLAGFVRFAKSIPSKLSGLGKAIMTGIASGITGAPGLLINALRENLRSAVDSLPGPLKSAAKAILPGMAKGGRAKRSGPHVVGEEGIEVVNLNRGDHVTPNARLGRAAGALTGGAAFLTVPIVVELDGYQVGRGMGRIALQDLARA